jgi:hypothetical protein
MTGTPQHGEAPLSVVSKHGFVKAAVEQGLSEVESPPKAAAKRPPKRLHFHRYIHILRDLSLFVAEHCSAVDLVQRSQCRCRCRSHPTPQVSCAENLKEKRTPAAVVVQLNQEKYFDLVLQK